MELQPVTKTWETMVLIILAPRHCSDEKGSLALPPKSVKLNKIVVHYLNDGFGDVAIFFSLVLCCLSEVPVMFFSAAFVTVFSHVSVFNSLCIPYIYVIQW